MFLVSYLPGINTILQLLQGMLTKNTFTACSYAECCLSHNTSVRLSVTRQHCVSNKWM